ncbi:hypothetical protein SASPL_120566 [Salvia splendens]|uniref:Uncharacterized protein n=1 Tax=Salvia splendens TaxID=180675 RepID=A0A8X8ZVE2_SALSN|nr:hypothetical protein SASPL_120566 [Salvia splendens]
METVVGMLGDDDARSEDFPLQDTADPVVYQLVRVDGNGRLVPATDNEVITAEDLLEDDKCKIRDIDAGQTLGCSINSGSKSCGSKRAEVEGSGPAYNVDESSLGCVWTSFDIFFPIQNILEVSYQFLLPSLHFPTPCVSFCLGLVLDLDADSRIVHGQPQLKVLEVGTEKKNMSPDSEIGYIKVDVMHEEISKFVPTAVDVSECQSGSVEGCSKHLDESEKAKTSNSPVGTDIRPDFSLLNGEIHLDSLSVKDLQEIFQVTFGRQTSVKDKQWLKRRIIMGLTNSCDFSTTTLVVIGNRVVKKGKDETGQRMDGSVLIDCVVTSALETNESPTTVHDEQIETHQTGNAMALQSSASQDNCESNETDTEHRPVKRVRKPTRRYIEEISEGESRDSGAQTVSSVEPPACDQSSAQVCVRSIQNFGLDQRYLLRKDSLGGFGVQVPYVNRIRRSRPRKNFVTLRTHWDILNGIVKIVSGKFSGNYLATALASLCTSETERKTLRFEQEVKCTESLKANLDDDVATVPTANGGMRRKHHRPWTLGEVVKLVEGVSKYGAGRWSEIKRLAFSSYSYRTSVDLKDKWRNLLRASMAESPMGNRVQNTRKHASVPIPAEILSRVRELADIHTQVTGFGCSDAVGHEVFIPNSSVIDV